MRITRSDYNHRDAYPPELRHLVPYPPVLLSKGYVQADAMELVKDVTGRERIVYASIRDRELHLEEFSISLGKLVPLVELGTDYYVLPGKACSQPSFVWLPNDTLRVNYKVKWEDRSDVNFGQTYYDLPWLFWPH